MNRTAQYRELNRANGLCGSGPHPNPEYETYAFCRACRQKGAARSKQSHDRLAGELADFTLTCAYSKCRKTFRPHRRRASVPWTVTCSPRCAHAHVGELSRVRGMAAAHEGRRRKAAAVLREEYATLKSDAEIAAYRLGFARGYRRGYERGATKKQAVA